MNAKLRHASILVLSAALCGCAANSQFNAIASDIMSSTGLVSSSQADAFLQAGTELSKAATPFSAEEQYYLGRGVAARVLVGYQPLKNDALQRYVNRVGNTVAAVSDQPETFKGYHFMVLDSAEINAMAAPSGFVFVTSAFVKALPDEDALAAVLAHEVAHVVKAHGVSAISNASVTKAMTLLGKEVVSSQLDSDIQALTDVFGDSVTDIADKLITRGYSREQEYASDRYAVTLLDRAGYDPRALELVLKVLDDNEEALKASAGWFSTHPQPRKRLGELRDAIELKPLLPVEKGRTIRLARFQAATKSL